MSAPLAELHVHLEGTLSTRRARELAARAGMEIGDLVSGERYRWEGFSGFLAAYERAAALLRTEDDFRRLARDYLTGIAADGAVYAELAVAPDLAVAAGLSREAYVRAVAQGCEEAEGRAGIVSRLVVTGVRHFGPEAVAETARFAARVALTEPSVTGFGLAGDERVHAPADFAAAFAVAREAGLGLTAHAGEFAGAEAVRETIRHLGVARVGHGVRAVEDEDVVAEVVERGIVLEVCPGSNLALGVYASAAEHPLRRLHEAGVRVTVSSDDPPFFGTDLAAEYALAGRMGFSAAERLALTRNAIEAAFVDEATRGRLLARMTLGAIALGAPKPSD